MSKKEYELDQTTTWGNHLKSRIDNKRSRRLKINREKDLKYKKQF